MLQVDRREELDAGLADVVVDSRPNHLHIHIGRPHNAVSQRERRRNVLAALQSLMDVADRSSHCDERVTRNRLESDGLCEIGQIAWDSFQLGVRPGFRFDSSGVDRRGDFGDRCGVRLRGIGHIGHIIFDGIGLRCFRLGVGVSGRVGFWPGGRGVGWLSFRLGWSGDDLTNFSSFWFLLSWRRRLLRQDFLLPL